MTLNPFYIIFILYFAANTYFFLAGLTSGGFVLLNDFYYVSATSYLASFLALIFFIFAFFAIYRFNSKSIRRSNIDPLSISASLLVIAYQIAYIIFFIQTGSGVLGAERVFDNRIEHLVHLHFKILQPDLVAIILLPFFRNRTLFFIGATIFVLSMILRGWMGGVYIAGILFLIRFYPVKLSFSLVAVGIILIAALPFLISLKWGVRAGIDVANILSVAVQSYNYESIASAINDVFSRFQHINNVALVFEHSDKFSNAFWGGEFRPIIFNGIVYDLGCHIFNSCAMDLNGYIVEEFYQPGGGWNVDPGLSGWLLLGPVHSVMTLLSLFFFGFLISWFVAKKHGRTSVLLFSSFSLLYFFHGWVSPYFNFVIHYCVLLAILSLSLHGRRLKSGLPPDADSPVRS